MNRQKKKRNHWVPQAYLRAFAADSPARRKVWTLSKVAGEPVLRPIRKVAVGFYLYAPRNKKGERDYSFEDKLASLEQQFGNPYWKHISTGYPDLTSTAIRKGLALLTAVMYLRNPRNLALMHDMHRQFVDFYSQFGELPDAVEIDGQVHEIDEESWPAYRDADDDAIKSMWLDNVGSAVWLAEVLMEMRWALLVSERPVFIATDNPVMVMHPELRFRGFRNKDSFVVFPLSPTRALHLDNRHSEPDAQFYDASKTAVGLNGLLWRESIDSVFSSRHPDQVCAEILADAEQMGFA